MSLCPLVRVRAPDNEAGSHRGINIREIRTERQEIWMSKSIKLLAWAGLLAGLAACAQPQEDMYVVVDPEPISVEPVFNSKY